MRQVEPKGKLKGMTPATADAPSAPNVVAALYLRTKTLHREAERTGIIRDLLHGEATREGYLLLLRNLLPAYRAMEQGLNYHRRSPALGELADYRLDRASAIEADLVALCGERWSHRIPLLEAGVRYATQMTQAAEGDGTPLIAHAYTRYLGDLSGGQILRRLLARSLGLQPSELSFYDFPRFADLDALKADYRHALDRAGAFAIDQQALIEEGAIAFSLNIDLSCAIKAKLTSDPIATVAAP